jgi:hypothetical protein
MESIIAIKTALSSIRLVDFIRLARITSITTHIDRKVRLFAFYLILNFSIYLNFFKGINTINNF